MRSIPRREASVRFHHDSRRWDAYRPRVDDIFITTPPKCGTTWMQGIVTALLWPDGDAPGPAADLSPWFDARLAPLDAMLARLDVMQHRRFVKTHTPADGMVLFPQCRYLAVYRDAADALVSWGNHRANMRPEIVAALNEHAAGDGLRAWPLVWDGDFDELLDETIEDRGTTFEHLASWWPYRREDFVLFVHYADLITDLPCEMRRIADFLDIDVPEAKWGRTVDACRFESLKRAHEGSVMLQRGMEAGSAAFFHRGESGRGRSELPAHVLRRLDALARTQLPDERARAWLSEGSISLGSRPESIC